MRYAIALTGVPIIFILLALIFLNLDSSAANALYLALGLLAASCITSIIETISRQQKAHDLARSLYVELADRVARCCFDFEDPWKHFHKDSPPAMSRLRALKFLPATPIIYENTAAEISLLKGKAAQDIVQFYFRLAAWKRDIEYIEKAFPQDMGNLPDDYVKMLALHLYQTLQPGLAALESLSSMVTDANTINADVIAPYDKTRGIPPVGNLKERIKSLAT